jgi:hypothetical protein
MPAIKKVKARDDMIISIAKIDNPRIYHGVKCTCLIIRSLIGICRKNSKNKISKGEKSILLYLIVIIFLKKFNTGSVILKRYVIKGRRGNLNNGINSLINMSQ